MEVNCTECPLRHAQTSITVNGIVLLIPLGVTADDIDAVIRLLENLYDQRYQDENCGGS